MQYEVDSISAGYRGRKVLDASFRLEGGECVLLAGGNGCGKSTLLRTLAGLLKPLSGEIPSASVVFVPSRIPRVAGFTVTEFLNLSRNPGEDSALMEEAVRLLHLEEIRDRDIATLSDGEFQRACIATAFVKDAEVVLLDEPTSFLDAGNRKMVLEMLENASREKGKAILYSSHDIQMAVRHVDRVMTIHSGKLAISGTAEGEKLDALRGVFPAVFE